MSSMQTWPSADLGGVSFDERGTSSSSSFSGLSPPINLELVRTAVRDLVVVFMTLENCSGCVEIAALPELLEGALPAETLTNDQILQRMIDESAPDGHHQRPVRELTIRHFIKFFITYIRAHDIDVETRELFLVFADEGRPTITPERLKKVLAGIGMTINTECAEAMMEVTDMAHDDALDFYEFKQIARIVQSSDKSSGTSTSELNSSELDWQAC